MERERKTHRVAQQLCTHCTIAATSPSSPFQPIVRGIDFLYAKSPSPSSPLWPFLAFGFGQRRVFAEIGDGGGGGTVLGVRLSIQGQREEEGRGGADAVA